MVTALLKVEDSEAALRHEFGPVGRALGRRYCPHVRVLPAAEAELRRLSAEGFVVHVQRTAAWVSFLYLAWLLVSRSLPPIRAVFNMRRWFVRPWRRVAQRGSMDVRLAYARRHGGSALVFLQTTAIGRARGRSGRENPFTELVAMARKSEPSGLPRPGAGRLGEVERRGSSLPGRTTSSGRPRPPGSSTRCWRSGATTSGRSSGSARRSTSRPSPPRTPRTPTRWWPGRCSAVLHVHLARETRAVFGPPYKPPERVIEETLRDRTLRQVIEQTAARSGKDPAALEREARRNLNAIAARLHPTLLAVMAPLMELDVRPHLRRHRRRRGRARAGAAGRTQRGAHRSLPEPQEPHRLPGDVLGALEARLPGAAGGCRSQPLLLPARPIAPARRRLLPSPQLRLRPPLHRDLQGVREEARPRRGAPGILPRGRPLADGEAAPGQARPARLGGGRGAGGRPERPGLHPGGHRLREDRGGEQLQQGARRR